MRYRRMLVRVNPIDSPTSKILAEMFRHLARNPATDHLGAYPISYRPTFVSCITMYRLFISGLHNADFRKSIDVANVDLTRFSLLPNNYVYAWFYTSLI